MPKGHWYDFEPLATAADVHDPDLPDLFFRGGSIVPMGPLMQHASEHALDPLTLVVAIDEHGVADGALYEDAGDGHAHKKGDYTLTRYHAKVEGTTCTVKVASRDGKRAPLDRRVKVVVLWHDAFGKTRTHVAHGHEGQPIAVKLI